MDIDEVPWLSGVPVAFTLSLVLYALSAPNFLSVLFPLYFTEVPMLFALGLEAARAASGRAPRQPFTVFLMALNWLLLQAVLWNSAEAPVLVWAFAVIQGFLAWQYFGITQIEALKTRSDAFTLTSLYIVTIIALAKLVGNLVNPLIPWYLLAGTFALLVACLGYLLPAQGYQDDWVYLLRPGGAVLAFITSLGFGAVGLSLL